MASRVYTRCRKVVKEWKHIENDFYVKDSSNDFSEMLKGEGNKKNTNA